MANITLTHPIHGAKVAISEQEARQDQIKGWVRYEAPEVVEPAMPSFLQPSVVKHESAVELPLNALTPVRKKRG